MKNLKFMYLILTCLSLSTYSCQDDDSGKEGPQGEQGPPGPQGEPGDPGEPGNANVIASPWIPSQLSSELTNWSYFDVNEPLISQAILDSGVLLGYGRYLGSNYVLPLPFIEDNQYYWFYMFPGRVRFGAYSISGNQIFDEISDFRYIIIPTGTAKTNILDFKNMSYEEVMVELGLDY